MQKNTNVLILCGGKGLRLFPITRDIPKPLVKINNKPLLKYIIDQVIDLNFNNIFIATGYKSNKIKTYLANLKNKKYEKINIFHSGNVDIIKRLELFTNIYKKDLIVMYGDTLANIDFNKLLRKKKVKKEVMKVSAFQIKSNFGLFKIAKNSSVTEYKEKAVIDNWINIGYFFIPNCFFKEFKRFSKYEKFLSFMQKNKKLFAHKHNGNHITVNTVSELLEAKKSIKLFNK